MKDYQPVMSFGLEVAASDAGRLRGDEDSAVDFLATLAGGQPALELAIGTGRIALPLAARGIRVDGIDFSEAMIAQLRNRPGGDGLAVTIGDFADVPVPGRYGLVYIVYNTLFNLLTQDEQVRCFENVARHLMDEGSFVVEAYSPAYLYRRLDPGNVRAEAVEVDQVWLEVDRHDAVQQMLEESHVLLSERGVRLHPIVQRYIWPAEMDLMARIAGLRLKERWGGWQREPFTAGSELHVSVYGQ